jgi:Protein of unknown function (DUF3224)
MTAKATGTFNVTGWDESTYHDLEGESKLTKARIDQAYSGDLEASGPWEGQMYYRPDGTAVYTGLQRLEGNLGGKSGAFVMESSGGYDGTTASNTWRVVEGSGTGGFAGLSGTGEASAEQGQVGHYTFEYQLG